MAFNSLIYRIRLFFSASCLSINSRSFSFSYLNPMNLDSDASASFLNLSFSFIRASMSWVCLVAILE